MEHGRGAVPDMSRPEAGVTLLSEWVAVAGRQRRAADAVVGSWALGRWPAGLLSRSCLLDADGPWVAQLSQWADDDAARAYTAVSEPRLARGVTEAVPGTEWTGTVPYLRCRSRQFGLRRIPGCIVLVGREFETPDTVRARRWVDAMFALPASDPPPGLISTHFHVSVDGARVLNYVEWTSHDEHRAAASQAPDAGAVHPSFREIETWPGLRRTTVRRFTPHRHTSGPSRHG
ncbi:antibiotic biosynthesis monooxygenase [Streptomyces sulfonofaciens]|uniref:Antibiotic biosynthesis monooxygenase n=1 Tax=Streptomyces sulfonofaciens TaxID=68272 RepID=A0A919KRL0_9ACTN|nr:antibiotic biosynthesis monooxygenase [Streptomyces sulfonofaciens]GHH69732.1 antibiotic biosynthesis monooxygenase [Streptomyces sulfonofaciens]